MRMGKERGVGDHAPPTLCTRDLAAVSLHLDFPGEHAVLTDGSNGIAGESATVLVVFGGIEWHSAGGWRGTLKREKKEVFQVIKLNRRRLDRGNYSFKQVGYHSQSGNWGWKASLITGRTVYSSRLVSSCVRRLSPSFSLTPLLTDQHLTTT